MNRIVTLQQRLAEQANPRTQAWWERYLKGVIPFRGVKMGDIRAALSDWLRDERIADELPPAEQKELALALLRERHCEDKLAGILLLQEHLIPAGLVDWPVDLPRWGALFAEGHIYDWNTCDWFCVKVLGPLAQQEGEGCARAIAAWRTADNLWQRRAAGVAFVNLAPQGEANFEGFVAMILEVCAATVRHPERFAQTGTGWLLRELSLADPGAVAGFVTAHAGWLSAEGFRYATAKLAPATQAALRTHHKAARRASAG